MTAYTTHLTIESFQGFLTGGFNWTDEDTRRSFNSITAVVGGGGGGGGDRVIPE